MAGYDNREKHGLVAQQREHGWLGQQGETWLGGTTEGSWLVRRLEKCG